MFAALAGPFVRAVAINVAANTNVPGFRGPVHPDGRFEYIPIPESKPVREQVPTYGDLDPFLETEIPSALTSTPVHLDPEFPEYPFGDRYTYGDEHGVKVGPLSALTPGDYVIFYATLSTVPASGERPAWLPPEWRAFVIGHFRLAREPVTGTAYDRLPDTARAIFANNAHVKREAFDARVLLAGAPDASRLYDRVVPLSADTAGADPGDLIVDHSSDSGAGPWWRRPHRFDSDGVAELLSRADG